MTTAELLVALARECPNGVSFNPMAVRLLRQKVPFEDCQIENLKAAMFQLENGLWFSREMISDEEPHQSLTYLKIPEAHWKIIRTSNLLERTFGEGRRRTKVVLRFPSKSSTLRLLSATVITTS